MPLVVFRRLDIHLAGKDDNDVTDVMIGLCHFCWMVHQCRCDDMSESIIGGASVGGDS